MRITIDVDYKIGDSVYLETDTEQKKRIVVGYNVKPNGEILYRLVSGTEETFHYGLEITKDKNVF